MKPMIRYTKHCIERIEQRHRPLYELLFKGKGDPDFHEYGQIINNPRENNGMILRFPYLNMDFVGYTEENGRFVVKTVKYTDGKAKIYGKEFRNKRVI